MESGGIRVVRKVVFALLTLMVLMPAAFAAEGRAGSDQYLTDTVFAKYQALGVLLSGSIVSAIALILGQLNTGLAILLGSAIMATISYLITIFLLRIARMITCC